MAVAMDEHTMRFPKTAWARRRLPLMTEVIGIEISSILSDCNHSLGGTDQHDASLAFQQDLYAEDVLR